MIDYEQKYKEALEWMKSLYNGLHGATKEEAEKYFPELKESEDERIRKALVRFHKSTIDVDGIKGEEIVAWLEKQSGCFAMLKKNTTDNKPTLNHSVLMKSIHGIAEGERNGKEWIQYRWSCKVKDSDVLYWMDLHELEKQGEQKEQLIDKACDVLVNCIEDFMFRRMEICDEECKKQTLENIRKTLEE